MRAFVHAHVSCSQDLIVAFMMGTHARLNADSPLRLLDDHLVACIAQMAIADRWCVRSCAHQHAFICLPSRPCVCLMSACMYSRVCWCVCVWVCVYVCACGESIKRLLIFREVCFSVCLSVRCLFVCLSVCMAAFKSTRVLCRLLCSANAVYMHACVSCAHMYIVIHVNVCMYAFMHVHMYIHTYMLHLRTRAYTHTNIRGMPPSMYACEHDLQPPRSRISILIYVCIECDVPVHIHHFCLIFLSHRGICSCACTHADCHFVNTRVCIRCWGPIA